MNYKKKVLINGFGSIGRKHAQIIKNNWSNFEISVLSSGLNKSTLIKNHELDFIKNNFECICDSLKWKPDYVIISNPCPLHIEHALIFARNKIPIFIEKPLGDGSENIESFKELLQLSKQIPIMVGYVFRHDLCLNYVEKYLQSKKADTLIEVESYCGSWLPDWRKNTDYKKSVSAKKVLGGGVLLELSHEIDLVNYLVGPVSIAYSSQFNSKILDIDVEDNAFIYSYSNSCKSIIIRLNFCTKPEDRYIKFQFSNEQLVWELINQKVFINNSNNRKEILFESSYSQDYKYELQLKSFFDFASNKIRNLSDLENGIRILDLISDAKSFGQ